MSSSKHSILVLSGRPWNDGLIHRLSVRLDYNFVHLNHPDELSYDVVSAIDPIWIMVPHWSHIIPQEIWSVWPTVVFHMTDLPYGRGGSPLQNLIKRGHVDTMITALLCGRDLDAGDIFLKQPLHLGGSAEEIFLRADALIEIMIEKLVLESPIPYPQSGKPVYFKRRKPDQSNLSECESGNMDSWYDHIRMLDATGYPHAFLNFNGAHIEFRRVSRRSNGLFADVFITPSNAMDA